MAYVVCVVCKSLLELLGQQSEKGEDKEKTFFSPNIMKVGSVGLIELG